MSGISHSKQQQFSTLYQQHQSWLYHWLFRKLGCSEHAADLAHDTWIRLLKQDNVIFIQQPRPYLATIAKGLMIDCLRRYRIEQSYLDALKDYPEQDAPSPETQYLIVETLMRLDQALSALPSPAKQAFLMSRLEGKKYKDIAKQLDLSVSSVEKYIAKALLTCLLVLQDECEI